MPPGGESPGSDIGAVLDILSRPDDDDLADVVELVAKICDARDSLNAIFTAFNGFQLIECIRRKIRLKAVIRHCLPSAFIKPI